VARTAPSPPIVSHASPITHHDSAIALVIVMIGIFVLSMLVGVFAWSMKVETKLARNANYETELLWLGRSGVEYCRYVLAEQMKCRQEGYTCLNQVWAGGSSGPCTTNGNLAEILARGRTISLGNGSFTWKMTDMESKWNINTANEQLLNQACAVVGVDAGEIPTVVGSILDWITTDPRAHHVGGAESDYYEGLNPSYEAKNGPIDDISELLLVKGILQDQAIYWGGAASNHAPAYFQQQLSRSRGAVAPAYPFGFVDLFTATSTGKININTASSEVLQLVPGVDKVMADGIVGARQGEDDGTGLTGPYRSVDQVQRVPEIGPIGLNRTALRQYCLTQSFTFQATIDAEINGYRRQFIAIIGTVPTPGPDGDKGPQILSFYWR
jgi:general secretion pathway protein K